MGVYVFLHEIPGQDRALIRVAGPDATRFLQGVLTADVEALPPGHATAAGLLTVKGKLVSDAVTWKPTADRFALLVPTTVASEVVELLDRHIVMDDVEVQGPTSPPMAIAWDLDEAAAAERRHGIEVRHPAPGWLFVATDETPIEPLLDGLDHGTVTLWERYRVRSGSPAWGHELAAGFFPPEVGFVHAVSYEKGCYMGQEPLARIHARGQVQRAMVRVEGPRDVTSPVPLVHSERPDAGVLTTWVEAESGGFVGLAVVRRALAQSGVELHVGSEDPIVVRVVSGPVGDDPGIGSRGSVRRTHS